MRRPPRPPLFPYTTLFRSAEAAGRLARDGRRRRRTTAPGGTGLAALGARRASRPRTAVGIGTAVLDRKSTRLNSSHRTISYAVFCLKKKTEEYTTEIQSLM